MLSANSGPQLSAALTHVRAVCRVYLARCRARACACVYAHGDRAHARAQITHDDAGRCTCDLRVVGVFVIGTCLHASVTLPRVLLAVRVCACVLRSHSRHRTHVRVCTYRSCYSRAALRVARGACMRVRVTLALALLHSRACMCKSRTYL